MNSLPHPIILITGASGFIGGALARRFIASGLHPRLLVREPSRLDPAIQERCEIIVGDLADLAALRRAVSGAATVFHCAANVNTWDSWENYNATNVLGVRMLLKAIEQEKPPLSRFVHLSSVDVYGFPSTPCDENAPAHGGPFGYGRSKVLGEAELLDAAKRLDLSYVILRPTNVIGPRGQFICRVGDELRSGLMLKVDHGRVDAGFLYIDNLLDCMLWAAQAPQAERKCYNVRDPEAVSWSRFLADLRYGIAGRGVVLDLPFAVANAAAVVLEFAWRLLRLRREPLLHRLVVFMFGRTCAHDINLLASAGAPLGGVGYEEAMRRSIIWYQETTAR
jgi:nucleoside-diphosphate-sugar epimerase